MSKSVVTFETFEVNKEAEIVIGLFFRDGKPFGHGHYSKDEKDGNLNIAFREGEELNYNIGELVVAVNNATGVIKGLFGHRLTRVDGVVDRTIEAYLKEKKSVA
ncbi:hypothetical protein [Maribacter luteus]|uniref:hypothetical protein n=1 Tax=Maribacter luteus TaxID=2594478 RepID=UPI002492FB56|nr:hypothetical protein [Maribacter luteus]